jgi:hypothetical protein
LSSPSERVGRQASLGAGRPGADRDQIVVVGGRRQAQLLDGREPRLELGLRLADRLDQSPRRLMRLIEPVHVPDAGLGLRLDFLEPVRLIQERLGVEQLLPLQRRGGGAGQLLSRVERVHDLEPAIPEFAQGGLHGVVECQSLSIHRRLEIGVGRGQELEPLLEGVEAVHDVGRLRPHVLDPAGDPAPDPLMRQPEEDADGQDDREERNAEPDCRESRRGFPRAVRRLRARARPRGFRLCGPDRWRGGRLDLARPRGRDVPRADPSIGFVQQGGDRLRIPFGLGQLDERRSRTDQITMHGGAVKPEIPERRPGTDRDLLALHRNDDDDRSLGVERQPARFGLAPPGRIHRLHIVRSRRLSVPRRLDHRDVVRLLRGLLQLSDLSREPFVLIGHPGHIDPLPIEFGEGRLVLRPRRGIDEHYPESDQHNPVEMSQGATGFRPAARRSRPGPPHYHHHDPRGSNAVPVLWSSATSEGGIPSPCRGKCLVRSIGG